MTTSNDTATAADGLQDIPIDHVLGVLEAIAIVKHERNMLDVPRFHQLNGANFFLDRDGGLAIDDREDRRPLVKLTPDEVYGMLVFVRLPGVATLIERLEAQRQDRYWADFDISKDEEAAKLASGIYTK
jgi:hypothetical protein